MVSPRNTHHVSKISQAIEKMLPGSFPASSSNFSAHCLVSLVASSPAVTAFASLNQSGDQDASCKSCMINVGLDYLFRAYWYTSPLGITLDTVSVVVTKYNNTAVTKRSTVYGDSDLINVSSVSEAQSIQFPWDMPWAMIVMTF